MVVIGTQYKAMNIDEEISEMVLANNGYVTRKEIDERRIPSIYLSRYIKKHELKQVTRGFYATKNWIEDPYIIFQHTYSRFVFSFNSAIYLNGLGDIAPNYLEVTGPLNYRPFPKKRENVFAHTETVDGNFNLGINEVSTPLGNIVRVYDKEKTICDLIKGKDKIEFETYAKALNIYAKSKTKDINRLMRYAKIMKIEKKVRNQMEVILNAN